MAGYIGKSVTIPTAKITEKRQSYTATAGQTAFTVTGGYDAGFADVYLNGVKLVNGVDVDVSSGTGFTLTAGATVGDTVDFIGYGAFLVADTYTQAEIDAKDALKVDLSDESYYQKDNILGTVSATGTYPNLVPTGAIIERGSNANGEYTKFADGTLICTYQNQSWTTAVGYNTYQWTFPTAFSDASYTAGMEKGFQSPSADGSKITLLGANRSTHTNTKVTFEWSQSAALSYSLRLSIVAIGRWF